MNTLCRAIIACSCRFRFAEPPDMAPEAALEAQYELGAILLGMTDSERLAFLAACAEEAGPPPKPGGPPESDYATYVRGLPGELCLSEPEVGIREEGADDDRPG